MPYERFAVAIRRWLAERHGATHPLYDFWVQDHLKKVDWIEQNYVPMLEHYGCTAGSRVIDVGCGTGAACVALRIHGLRAVGVDASEQVLALARLRAHEDGVDPAFVKADGLALPFADGDVDACICDQVVEHMPGYRGLVAEVYRILRPGGLFLLSVPHRLAIREGHSGLLFASWLPHAWAKRYVTLRGRRTPVEPWDVWLNLPWTVRRRLREAGFQEIRSPWKQPRRHPMEGGRVRRALARLRPLVGLVHWGFRWRQLLLSTLMFVLVKPSADSMPGDARSGR